MIESLLDGFDSELEKIADIIPRNVFNSLDNYDKQKLGDAKDLITQATKKNSKLSSSARGKMIESAFDTAKEASHGMARTTERKVEEKAVETSSSNVPKSL